jgi:hypothetical protein
MSYDEKHPTIYDAVLEIERLKAELAAAREDRKCENTDCSNVIDGNQNPGVCLPCWNKVAVENAKLRASCLRVACLGTTLSLEMLEHLAAAGRGEGV